VNGRKRSGAAGIEELKKIERLGASNFAQQKAIGAMTERGFEQVANGHGRDSAMRLTGFEAHEIRVRYANFGRVLDQQDPFVFRNEFLERA
jgi:hypothetical protein